LNNSVAAASPKRLARPESRQPQGAAAAVWRACPTAPRDRTSRRPTAHSRDTDVCQHFAAASTPQGARPARCQRNRPEDTQNPAHRL